MGIYLNSDDTDFRSAVKYSRIYVDKTELIRYTKQRFTNDTKIYLR